MSHMAPRIRTLGGAGEPPARLAFRTMAAPRLLLSTAAFFARPLATTFELAAECGYTGVEVMVTKDRASQSASVMRDLAAEHGLQIGALHAPALLLTRSVWGKDPIGKIDTATRVAPQRRSHLVVMRPPYRWQRAYRRWLLASPPGSGAHRIAVAMETCSPAHRLAAGMLHADQDGSAHEMPLRSTLARGGRQPRPDPGATAVRDRLRHAPVGQRRKGGTAPAARRRCSISTDSARSRGRRLDGTVSPVDLRAPDDRRACGRCSSHA
jgi:hypothetical protein